jgi:hypothetical protein
MHVPINVKSPNNISKWQMEFNLAFKGLSKPICNNRQYSQKYPTKRTDHKRLHTSFGIASKFSRLKIVRQFTTRTVTMQFRPLTSYSISNIAHFLQCIHALYIRNQEGKFKAKLTPL